MKQKKTVNLNLRIDEELSNLLEKQAKKEGKTKTFIVEESIRERCDKIEFDRKHHKKLIERDIKWLENNTEWDKIIHDEYCHIISILELSVK